MRCNLVTFVGFVLSTLIVAGVAPAAAQAPLTTADIQRLQDNVYDASRDIATLRGRDARLADSLEAQLDDLRDEVVYLKVKLRKEPGVSRAEYADLRDRIERVRNEARGEPARVSRPAPADSRVSATEIPVGTEFEVRLQTRLNSGTAKVEDRFDATTS